MIENKTTKFAIRIHSLRVEKGLSGEELGKIFGVSKVSVWQWENGINYPNNNILLQIANYFNVSTDYLLGVSDIRNNIDINLDEFEVALHGEVKELTDDAKEKILEYARFLKSNANNKK